MKDELRFGVNYGFWTNMKAPNWPEWNDLISTDLDTLPEDVRLRHYYEPSYHPSMRSVARHSFPGIEKIKGSYSQSMQDIFVLTLLNGKTNGTYLELGSFEPIKYNNTYLLSQFGWNGISIDIQKDLESLWKQHRPDNTFISADAIKIDYKVLLESLPNVIDYLQIDIDAGEGDIEVLSKLLDTGKRFSVITFEHEQVFQKKSCDILTAHGYQQLVENVVCRDFGKDLWHVYEDWWIDPATVDLTIAEKFKNISVDKTYPFELFCQPKSVDNLMSSVLSQKNIWDNQK